MSERHMDSHLVTVEVSIESVADERMELQSLALDKHRLESLNAETVKRRSSVEHDRMLLDDLIKDSPYLRRFLLYKHLRPLDVLCDLLLLELAHDERLEELESHLGRNTALMHPQLRSDDDYRTSGVVDTLSEKVLPEPSLLALEDIGE